MLDSCEAVQNPPQLQVGKNRSHIDEHVDQWWRDGREAFSDLWTLEIQPYGLDIDDLPDCLKVTRQLVVPWKPFPSHPA